MWTDDAILKRLFFPLENLASSLKILDSVSASTADVGSSKINIAAFFKNARAIEIRCRCPPDNEAPPSLITVS